MAADQQVFDPMTPAHCRECGAETGDAVRLCTPHLALAAEARLRAERHPRRARIDPRILIGLAQRALDRAAEEIEAGEGGDGRP